MRAAGKKLREIGEVLGRNAYKINNKFRNEDYHARKNPVATEILNAVRPHVPPPQEVLIDRDRRLLAPRTLTAIMMGDPAPGQSALDRMKAAAVAILIIIAGALAWPQPADAGPRQHHHYPFHTPRYTFTANNPVVVGLGIGLIHMLDSMSAHRSTAIISPRG
jgi:hypothetical protein